MEARPNDTGNDEQKSDEGDSGKHCNGEWTIDINK